MTIHRPQMRENTEAQIPTHKKNFLKISGPAELQLGIIPLTDVYHPPSQLIQLMEKLQFILTPIRFKTQIPSNYETHPNNKNFFYVSISKFVRAMCRYLASHFAPAKSGIPRPRKRLLMPSLGSRQAGRQATGKAPCF